MKKIILLLLAMLLTFAGCAKSSGQNNDSLLPEEIVASVVEALFYVTESDSARSVIGGTAADTRLDFAKRASEHYLTLGEFTPEQSLNMVNALFNSIDRIISYNLSETEYTDDTTAFVDVNIKTMDHNDFAIKSRAHLESIIPDDYNELPPEEKARYSYEAFIASCEGIIPTSGYSIKVRAKLVKYQAGWRIDQATDFILKLLSAYIGTPN